MSDDKPHDRPGDRGEIDLTQALQVIYWSDLFMVTPERLRAAVAKVGKSVSAVERELKG